jgi:hypothetical protein
MTTAAARANRGLAIGILAVWKGRPFGIKACHFPSSSSSKSFESFGNVIRT